MPRLTQALIDVDRLQRRRFHMPAHAGLPLVGADAGPDILADPYRFDLTELDGLDVLSEPSGCIAEAQAQAAETFGAAHSFFLLNGASVGVMAAMLSALRPGDKVLLPRNVHRSVLSGLILTGAQPVWFLPGALPDWCLWGPVTVDHVTAQLAAHPDIKALVLTSPTYEGLGSDIGALSALCRARDILLIVDEAHGTLWPFSDALPVSALKFSCDAVIHSVHKGGGSLTQTALAHLPHGSKMDALVFQQALNTLQTTSPSYLLMASLDAACHFLASDEGRERVKTLVRTVQDFRRQFNGQLQALRLLTPDDTAFWDPCKFYFTHPLESGEDWGARLEQDAQLAYESASSSGVLYLANIGLQPEDFAFFRDAILAEDKQTLGRDVGYLQGERPQIKKSAFNLPEIVLAPREAFFAPGIRVLAEAAAGRIAKETIVHCPPGIPVLMPGERIQAHHIPLLPQGGVLVIA